MRIAVIGAGSAQFILELAELCALGGIGPYEVAMVDTHPVRLEVARAFGHRVAAQTGTPVTISAPTTRAEALAGADVVVVSIGVGLQDSIRIDFEVTRRHGLRQTVADTASLGAVMRILRTAPVLADLARDMLRLCPDALMLSVTNPMAMCVMALDRMVPDLDVVGLCHSTWMTARDVAGLLEIDPDELEWGGVGVNHQVFLSRLEHRGTDVYPRLRALAHGDGPFARTLRADLLRRVGYYVTESSRHAAEYVGWYLPWTEQVSRFGLPESPYWERRAANVELFSMAADVADGRTLLPFDQLLPTGEYAPQIIRSLVDGARREVYVNVPNSAPDGGRWVEELQADGVVEVPAHADGDGVHPRRGDPIPPQCAALNRRYLDLCDLGVRAVVEGARAHVHHAALLDPNAAASMPPDRIGAMVEELLDAHQAAGFLPEPLWR